MPNRRTAVEESKGGEKNTTYAMWNGFQPLVIMMTISGGTIKGLTSKKPLCIAQWCYSVIMMIGSALSVYYLCNGSFIFPETWNQWTAYSIALFLSVMSYPIYALCNMKMSYGLKQLIHSFDMSTDSIGTRKGQISLMIKICTIVLMIIATILCVFIIAFLGRIAPFSIWKVFVYFGLLVKSYTIASMIGLCLASAVTCFHVIQFIKAEISSVEKTYFATSVENCRLKYEQ